MKNEIKAIRKNLKEKFFHTDYKDFIELLEDSMFRTIGHIRGSINTNACHTERMLKLLDKDTANFILDEAEYHAEFNQDSIKFYRSLINK